MMRRDERRRLDAIERQLSEQDPEFARALTTSRPLHRLLHHWTLRAWLIAVLVLLAGLCILLGEATPALIAATTAGAVYALRGWQIS